MVLRIKGEDGTYGWDGLAIFNCLFARLNKTVVYQPSWHIARLRTRGILSLEQGAELFTAIDSFDENKGSEYELDIVKKIAKRLLLIVRVNKKEFHPQLSDILDSIEKSGNTSIDDWFLTEPLCPITELRETAIEVLAR